MLVIVVGVWVGVAVFGFDCGFALCGVVWCGLGCGDLIVMYDWL